MGKASDQNLTKRCNSLFQKEKTKKTITEKASFFNAPLTSLNRSTGIEKPENMGFENLNKEQKNNSIQSPKKQNLEKKSFINLKNLLFKFFLDKDSVSNDLEIPFYIQSILKAILKKKKISKNNKGLITNTHSRRP